MTDRQIDQFLVVSRSVGTFARALDCSSSVKQPSLHMSAAAASRDITLVLQLLHIKLSLAIASGALMACFFFRIALIPATEKPFAHYKKRTLDKNNVSYTFMQDVLSSVCHISRTIHGTCSRQNYYYAHVCIVSYND